MKTLSGAIAAVLTVALIAGACMTAPAEIQEKGYFSGLQLTEVARLDQCVLPDVAETDATTVRRHSARQEPALDRYVGTLPESKLEQLALALHESRQRLGVEQRVSALMRRVLWLLLQQDGCTS